MATESLTFALLDDLALAVMRGRVQGAPHLSKVSIERVGPLVELLIIGRKRELAGIDLNAIEASPIVAQLRKALTQDGARRGCHYADTTFRAGFITTSRKVSVDDPYWDQFCAVMQEAAQFATLHYQIAKGLVGAMIEMEDNIHLHSQRSYDGIVGYRATRSDFEFVVADSGIGVLASLRQSPDYAELRDAGTAIRLALKDGESRLRHEQPGHGYGFHGLFVGLANLNGHLRFRSDDHVLTIDGTSPSLMSYRLSQAASIEGFVASIHCRAD